MLSARLLDRYLLREAGLAWLAVTSVLLGIMLSTRFARFLAEAAAGELPREILFKVVALSSMQYLVILIPVSLLLAVMLALGRLYKEQEVTAMTACGVGIADLYRPFFGLAVILSALTGLLALELGPWAGRQVDYLVKDARRLVQYAPFEAGQFKEVAGGRAVFYTARLPDGGRRMEDVFIHVADPAYAGVITARRGEQTVEPETGERQITLFDGFRYAGQSGQLDYEIARFGEYGTRVTPPDFIYTSAKRKVASSAELMASDDLEDKAELQWRIAAPVTVLLLVLLAVPLSHARPRQGRYGKLVYGIVAYLIYVNLLGLGQAAITGGVLPPTVGMWWVHALVLAAAMLLIARRSGWGRG